MISILPMIQTVTLIVSTVVVVLACTKEPKRVSKVVYMTDPAPEWQSLIPACAWLLSVQCANPSHNHLQQPLSQCQLSQQGLLQ